MKDENVALDTQPIIQKQKIGKRKNTDLLNDHGSSGWLIMRLQRYSILGWVLFFLLSIVFLLYVFIVSSKPVPVIAVSASGKVLGSFEYLSPTLRTDEEIINGTKHWLKYFYSINSRTIFEDYTAALNMMSERLRKTKLKEVIELNYLQRIEGGNTTSYIEYTDVKLLARKGLTAIVELAGTIEIDNGRDLITKPFYIRLDIEAVTRSTLGQLGTIGIKINRVVEK